MNKLATIPIRGCCGENARNLSREQVSRLKPHTRHTLRSREVATRCDTCRGCEHQVELDNAPVMACGLLLSENGKPCSRAFAQVLTSPAGHPHTACPWNQKREKVTHA